MSFNQWSLAFIVMINTTAFAGADGETISDFIPSKISTSTSNSCVLSKKGQVKCWGSNFSGQLGLGTQMDHGREPGTMGTNLPLVNFGTNLYAKDICNAAGTTCVATTDGRVKCWGDNYYGQLGQERDIAYTGRESNDMGDNLPFTNLGSDFKVKSLHCGTSTICALSDTGKLKCWGDGSRGQLGLSKNHVGREKGDMGDKLPFVPLRDTLSYVGIGSSSICAASKSDIYCWGDNEFGQAGIGSTNKRVDLPNDPAQAIKVKLEDAMAATVVEDISAGINHNCALYHLANRPTEQKVKCWGVNFDGALGTGANGFKKGNTPDTIVAKLPATLLTLGQIKKLEGHLNFSCALAQNGDMKCWGANVNGALGLGDAKSRGIRATDMGQSLPSVDLGLPVITISSGPYTSSSCAILINHEIKCWGEGDSGALGYEDTLDRGAMSYDMGENLPYVHYR